MARSPSDFIDLLNNPIHGIVVGGQAANIWALHYQDRYPELKALQPYTSKDIDFVGNEQTITQLAKLWNVQPLYPEDRLHTPVLANLSHPDGRKAEVLRHLYGVKPGEVEESAVTIHFQGQKIQIIHPIFLVLGKAHNLIGLDQTNRQDSKHLRIAILTTKAFLEDLIQSGAPQRDVFDLIEIYLEIASSLNKQIRRKESVDWEQGLPIEAMKKLAWSENFFRHRLPTWQQLMKPKSQIKL